MGESYLATFDSQWTALLQFSELKQPGEPFPARTILIVDDEEVVRTLLTRALAGAGYRVLEATHGQAALRVLEASAGDIDLVVSDLVMPVMNGRELRQRIVSRWPDVPMLYVSGYPEAYLQTHELFDPEVPLLRKPFLPSRLLESVEEALAPSPNGPPDSAGVSTNGAPSYLPVGHDDPFTGSGLRMAPEDHAQVGPVDPIAQGDQT
ncbi:MAG: response regulator [Gemmatimonadales bacterium]|nr:response regulator [Gemmatimonadales bacterium]MDQ3427270.1 response regulator [Gemmatimonadota bacterium]